MESDGKMRMLRIVELPRNETDEEHFSFTVEVSVSPTFFSWVFMFGGKIKILGPQSVKDAYEELIMQAID